MNFKGYVPLRRGLIEHVRDGRLTSREAWAFCTLVMLADKETGSYTINAPTLAAFMPELISDNAQPKNMYEPAKRVLHRLEEKGYIFRKMTPGARQAQPYWVDKYVITAGPKAGTRIDLTEVFKTKDVTNIKYTRCEPDIDLKPQGVSEASPLFSTCSDTRTDQTKVFQTQGFKDIEHVSLAPVLAPEAAPEGAPEAAPSNNTREKKRKASSPPTPSSAPFDNFEPKREADLFHQQSVGGDHTPKNGVVRLDSDPGETETSKVVQPEPVLSTKGDSMILPAYVYQPSDTAKNFVTQFSAKINRPPGEYWAVRVDEAIKIHGKEKLVKAANNGLASQYWSNILKTSDDPLAMLLAKLDRLVDLKPQPKISIGKTVSENYDTKQTVEDLQHLFAGEI